MATRNKGVLIEMTINAESMFMAYFVMFRKASGICFSVDSMSLENLLTILPIGVLSKNSMFPRSIEKSIELWRFLEALVKSQMKRKSTMKLRIP